MWPGDGWAQGTWLKLHHCSRALLPKHEQNTPLDPVPSTPGSLSCPAQPLSSGVALHPSLSSQLSQDPIPLPLVPSGVQQLHTGCSSSGGYWTLRNDGGACAPALPRLFIPTELHPNGTIQTLDEQCSPQQLPVSTVQRAGAQRGRSISSTEGCLCTQAALWPLLSSQGAGRQHSPDQPLPKMRCSAVLEECRVKGF